MRTYNALYAALGALSFFGNAQADLEQIVSCTKPNTIAPTFDDGPSIYTSDLLDILGNQSEPVKLTFFVIGEILDEEKNDIASKMGEILARMDREGHQIAMHSYSHPDLTTLQEDKDIINQVLQCSDQIYRYTKKRPRYFRCPYGTADERVLKILKEHLGLEVIHWSGDAADTNDWKEEYANNATRVVETYRQALKMTQSVPSIFLQHDTYRWSTQQAPQTWIPLLREKGMTISRVDKCLEDAKSAYFEENEWSDIVAKLSSSAGSGVGAATTTTTTTSSASQSSSPTIATTATFGFQSSGIPHTTCTVDNTIAPLFYDGPSENTKALLDIARNQSVRLTFFLLGSSINDQTADIIQQMATDDHTLALHTDTDPLNMTSLSREDILKEVIDNSQKIFNCTGKRPRYFLCPFDSCDQQVWNVLAELGLEIVSVGTDVKDWDESIASSESVVQVYRDALNATTPQTLFSQSDIYKVTVNAAVDFLPLLKANNKLVVPVNECLNGGKSPYFDPSEWDALVAKANVPTQKGADTATGGSSSAGGQAGAHFDPTNTDPTGVVYDWNTRKSFVMKGVAATGGFSIANITQGTEISSVEECSNRCKDEVNCDFFTVITNIVCELRQFRQKSPHFFSAFDTSSGIVYV